MSDISGITNLSSASAGDTSLTGIQAAATNLNTDKAEKSLTVNGKALSTNPVLGLASTDFANQGTNITVLHGSATGSPAFGAVVEADQTLADNTTANVSSTKHGYAPKSPADATKFLNGAATPAYAQPKDSDLSTTDITTNDVTTAKHGFTPKAPSDSTKFLRGDATWAVPTSIIPKTGTTTRDASAASGNQTIAHGVGKTPILVRISATYHLSSTSYSSFGTYDGSATSCVWRRDLIGASPTLGDGIDSTNIINVNDGVNGNVATITVDATNITLAWTKTGSPTNSIQIMWEAIG